MRKIVLLFLLVVSSFALKAQCDIEVTVSSAGWGDNTAWELQDAANATILTGAIGFVSGYSDVQTTPNINPPYTLIITVVDPNGWCDNAPDWSVTVGGVQDIMGSFSLGCAGVETLPVLTTLCPSCIPPSASSASSITSTSASLLWTVGGSGETEWDIDFGVAPYASSGTPTVGYDDVTSNPIAVSGLLSGTTYNYYVRADCDAAAGTAESAWAGPFSFTTACLTFTAPFAENFDAGVTTPNCWTNTPGGEPWSFAISGTVGPAYGVANAVDHTTGIGNFAWIDASVGIGVNELISPMIDMSALTTPQVGYWIFSNNTDDLAQNTIELYAWDGAAWVLLNTYGGNFAGWLEVIVPVPGAIPTTTQFRLVQVESTTGSGSAYYNDLLVDDFFVNETPLCPAPAAISMSAVVTLPSTADLSWTSSGVGNTYTVEYRVVGAGAWTAAPGNPYAGTTAQLLGLSTDDFEWQVASNCVGPVTSAFSGGTFTTVPFPGTCATAQAIGPGTFIAPGPSMGGGAANLCAGAATNANWYAYTATVTGTAAVESTSGGDTYVEVSDAACGALVCYASNDDGGVGALSLVTFDVCAGSTYYIEWTDRWGATAAIGFDVTETAACADPSTAAVTSTLDGFDATTTWTAGGGSCGGGYEWALVADAGIPLYGVGDIAFGTGTYPVSLAAVTGLSSGTPYDLYVRDVCGATFSLDVLTNFTTVAACAAPGGLAAVVTLPSTADLSWTTSGVGNTYTVEYRVVGAGAWTAAPGNPYAGTTAQLLGLSTDEFEWQVASNCVGPVTSAFASGTFTTIPFPGTCATAQAIGPGTFIAPGPSMGGGAANLCFGAASNANWYAYTAVVSGTATVESTSGGDTYVEVSDAACGALVCYASNDDGGVGALSLVTFTICAGSTYYIEWTDRWGATAPIGFDVTETAACADPGTASGIITLDGLDASTSWPAGSGACGGGFEWEVVADGAAAFSGNDLASGTGSYPVSIPAVTGLMSSTPYDLYVRDVCGAIFSNDILTNFTTLDPPPTNNDCADAITVYGGYSITGFSTVGATGTDITSCTSNDVASVWFEYTPACNTTVEVNSCGSTYDTNLSIWDACSGGTELACNDDAGAGACSGSLQSFVSFAALANTTYYIRIAGWNGSTGLINFAVNEVTVCPCTQNVWTGASLLDNTDWSDADNWTCTTAPTNDCLTPLGSDIAIIPAGTVLAPVITGTQGAVSLEVGVGSSITIDGTLQICGNVMHNGNSFTGAGDLELNGTATQMLSGNGAFGMVELNNAAGASVMASASLSVDTALILTAGTFTNNGSFSLNSALLGTAYLNDWQGAGTYSGDLTVNRFIPDGHISGLGQRFFGSAVSGSVVSGLDNTYTVYPLGYIVPTSTCNPDTIDPASPYSNLLEWRENSPFPTACSQEGWYALNASSSALAPGRGYSGWMNNSSTISVTGAPNSGVSYALTNTPSGVISAQGYHLLTNPFPSPMDVDAVYEDGNSGSLSGISSVQYYQSSSDPYGGTFQSALMSGDEIPVMQGFTAYVAPGGATYNPGSNFRIASTDTSFSKSNDWFDYRLDLEVNINGVGADVTYVYYSSTTTDQFDVKGDCAKRESDAGKPTLYTRSNSEMMGVNGLNLNDLGTSVPMGLLAPSSTTASLNFAGMNDFPANTTIYIEDLVEAVFHNVADGDYTFNTDPSQNGTDRFVIHFVLPASFNLVEPTCENTNGAIIENTNDGRAFEVTNDGNVVDNGILDGSSNALAAGDYTIEVFDVYGGSQLYDFTIDEVTAVTAGIISSASGIEAGESIDFEFNGADATAFEWTINGQVVAQTELFNYQFVNAGQYVVEVFASNDLCEAIASQIIDVAAKTTSIVEVGNGSLAIYEADGNVTLNFVNVNQGEVEAAIYNLLGQEIVNVNVESSGKQTIQNVNWANGYYLVKVQIADQVVHKTILLTK